jgi:hypothetical protein
VYTEGVIPTPSRAIVTIFGVTVFLGAFLLFQVQLVIGKYILPWYGGVPMVWTICMLCFQVLLLAGYAYAHLLVRRLPDRSQRLLHLAVVVMSLAALALLIPDWGVPLLPNTAWKPDAADTPAWHIVQVLAVAVGAPFFVVATTSPLIQSWFGTAFPTSSPYRLYALSNLGSLLALLSYPALVEVWLPLRAQAWLWTAGFVLFAVGVGTCALKTTGGRGSKQPPLARDAGIAGGATPPTAPAPRARDWLLWLALSGTASALLLATTNYVSQEIAVIPFLWIVPLSLYLASFVLTFDSERWYARAPWATLLALGITLSAFVLERDVGAHVLLQIGVAAFTLFAACMVCHGELARTKPAASHLTSFYLAITVGGAVGGAFVSLAAPVVFPGMWEYPLGLWMVAVLALVTFHRDRGSPLHASPRWTLAVTAAATLAVAAQVFRRSLPWTPEISDVWLFGTPAVVAIAGLTSRAWGLRRRPADVVVDATPRHAALTTGAVALGVIVVGIALGQIAWSPLARAAEHSRSFYGIVHVEVVDPDRDGHEVRLRHGRIVHGKQYRATDYVREPTAYYGRDSGVGLAIEHHPRRDAGLRVGVVGLGAGTLAAYGRAGDTLRFYELNPDVSRLAGRDGRTFTFVRDSAARIEIVVGDARLMLEAELARGIMQRFDVLAIDAFSSDAIPAHLLTREAVRGYLAHLDPGGILALHITNRYIELKPVVRGLAAHFGLAYKFIATIDGNLTWRNDWALLARDPARLAIAPISDMAEFEPSNAPVVVWTDDYSNLLRLLKR